MPKSTIVKTILDQKFIKFYLERTYLKTNFSNKGFLSWFSYKNTCQKKKSCICLFDDSDIYRNRRYKHFAPLELLWFLKLIALIPHEKREVNLHSLPFFRSCRLQFLIHQNQFRCFDFIFISNFHEISSSS